MRAHLFEGEQPLLGNGVDDVTLQTPLQPQISALAGSAITLAEASP